MAPSSDSGRIQAQKPEVDAGTAPSDAPAQQNGTAATQAAPFNQTKFGIVTLIVGLAVLVVFLLNMAYLFGSSFRQPQRNHVFKIAAVNYDDADADSDTGGVVWDSFTSAYGALRSNEFPTFVFLPSSSSYPDPERLVAAVREQQFWGAVYVNRGASARLEAAVAGRSESYNATSAVTYVWNEIRYPATSASVILTGILTLQAAAQKAFQAGAAASLLRGGANSSHFQTAVAAYLTPFDAAEVNVAPAPQAEKAFYNTVVVAMSIIQQNVFLIAFAGVARQLGLFAGGRPFRSSAAWALLVGLAYTMIGSLVTAGYVWAYREGWAVTGTQFAATWMVLWLVHHIYYQLLDGTLALVPIQYFTFILVTFVFVNISATVFPLESMPGFYRWGHALPSYQCFQVLLNVWSRGSHRLYEALPVLFTWWLISASYAAVGTMRKVQNGRKGGAGAAPAGAPVST